MIIRHLKMPVSTQTRFWRILHRRHQHFCAEMLCRLHKRYDAVISVRAERWCITQKVRYDFFRRRDLCI